MLKKIVLLFFLSVSVFSLSMCKNVFSALSEPVTENYYQISLPRTGQTAIYQAGDDGSYQKGAVWPYPRFIVQETTVTDRLTGLIWERAPINASFDWVAAFSRINTLNTGKLGGYSDWRLPNVNELASLVNYGQANPGIWLNTQGFIGVQNNNYWSSSTVAGSSSNAWAVNMNYGQVHNLSTGTNYYVLAIRKNGGGAICLPKTGQTAIYQPGDDGSYQKGAVWPSPRFNDNGNGTITDRLTGLMWERVPASPAVFWSSAISYCENLTLGGYSDWRLPNVSELKSLVNYEQENSDYWLNNTQGFENIAHSYYFTASTQTGNIGSVWLVTMTNGVVLPGTKGGNNYVLAVRGGM